MNREDIIVAVHEITGYANKAFRNKISVPSISFYSKGAVAGRAFYESHRVEFNEVLAKENTESFINTVAHEIAHLVTRANFPNAKQAHGPEFKHVMRTLGYDHSTYHSYDTSSVKRKVTKTRYIYTCACERPLELTRQKHEVANTLICKICKSKLKFTGEVKKFI